MPCRNAVCALLVTAVLCATFVGAMGAGARAFDESRYPDWSGQWLRPYKGPPVYDPTKPAGEGQRAPLIPEYRALLAASMEDQDAGGPGDTPSYICMPFGMPRTMQIPEGAEFVITPGTTYILMESVHESRRIFTDGRDFPAEIEASYNGYSIGRWTDAEGSGRYTVLEIETRGFKGPRVYDHTGMLLHRDNQSVIKERIFQDKADPTILYDQMTTIDHALTHPWNATQMYRHDPDPRPVWHENVCAENNPHLEIAKQGFMLSADGLLMPAKKNQPPPDLSYFKPAPK